MSQGSAPRALITGIAGQDGSYLAELLLDKGYEVHGMVRRSSGSEHPRIAHLGDRLVLHRADLADAASLKETLMAAAPDEIYNLAGTSFVAGSWRQPTETADLTATAVTRLLEAMRDVTPEARLYQASSSEMFGRADHAPQTEDTPLRPRTPYGAAKAYAHFMTVNYRETYGLFACSGILFNHESPRRGVEYLTRKVTNGVAAIKLGLEDHLLLGSLDAERDWGYAKDYVEAMWLMLQQDRPADYVIASGTLHTVRDVVDAAFEHVGLDPAEYVRQDERFMRPADVIHLVGDAGKAERELGWRPRTGFDELIRLMVDSDLELLAQRAPQKQSG